MTFLETPDQIHYDLRFQGLTEQTIRGISAELNEPERMLQQRLDAREIFKKIQNPDF